MKLFLTGILAAIALLCTFSIAQDTTSAPTSPATPPAAQAPVPTQSAPVSTPQASTPTRIAPGSVIPVQLTKSIDAKKAKAGDEVEATVTQDMKTGNGEVLVPKDTKVVGRVTEAQARSKEQKESQLGIAFDRAVMKTGGDMNLPMSIQAIIAPSYLSANNGSGGEGAGQQQSPQQQSAGSAGGMSQGRAGNMGGSQPPTPTPSTAAGPTEGKTGNGAHEPITGNTQGVLGIPNTTLSNATSAAQGSVVTSEKNNVKLESGTLMLLRVNQPAAQQ